MESALHEIVAAWQALLSLLAFEPGRLAEPDMIVRLILMALLLTGSAFFSS